MLLNQSTKSLTDIAYESDYYDQAHFIKDFKEFTGLTPKEFLKDEKMALSSILYKKLILSHFYNFAVLPRITFV